MTSFLTLSLVVGAAIVALLVFVLKGILGGGDGDSDSAEGGSGPTTAAMPASRAVGVIPGVAETAAAVATDQQAGSFVCQSDDGMSCRRSTPSTSVM